jgi:hypothetical protein
MAKAQHIDQLRARIKEEKASGVIRCRASTPHTSNVANPMIGAARSRVTPPHAKLYPGKRVEKTHPRQIEDDSAQRLINDRMSFWQRTGEPRWDSESMSG